VGDGGERGCGGRPHKWGKRHERRVQRATTTPTTTAATTTTTTTAIVVLGFTVTEKAPVRILGEKNRRDGSIP